MLMYLWEPLEETHTYKVSLCEFPELVRTYFNFIFRFITKIATLLLK